MRYLGSALYAEGPDDYYFLMPLLRRVCEKLCREGNRGEVEIGEIYPLDDPDEEELEDQTRATRIATAARTAEGAWHILFVHTDAGGNPRQAHNQRIAPALEQLADLLVGEQRRRGIAVVPIRETEAWTLVDGNAFRDAFGVNLTDVELGLPPHVRGVEMITDPKAELAGIFKNALGETRRKVGDYLAALGERVSLQQLSYVPAFRELLADLTQALRELRFLE